MAWCSVKAQGQLLTLPCVLWKILLLSGSQPASYPMGTRGSFPGAKAAGGWSWHFHLVPRSRMRGVITPFPQRVFMAWCLDKHRDNFTFLYPFTVYSLNGFFAIVYRCPLFLFTALQVHCYTVRQVLITFYFFKYSSRRIMFQIEFVELDQVLCNNSLYIGLCFSSELHR
jgi:hypothetical protein